jgi:hypothetical protein
LAIKSRQTPSILIGYAMTCDPPSGHDIQDLMSGIDRQLAREWAAIPGNAAERAAAARMPVSNGRDLDHTVVATSGAARVIRIFFEAVREKDDEAAKHSLAPALWPKAHGLWKMLTDGDPDSIEVDAVSPSPEGHDELLVELRQNYSDWRGSFHHPFWVTVKNNGNEWLIARIRNLLE